MPRSPRGDAVDTQIFQAQRTKTQQRDCFQYFCHCRVVARLEAWLRPIHVSNPRQFPQCTVNISWCKRWILWRYCGGQCDRLRAMWVLLCVRLPGLPYLCCVFISPLSIQVLRHVWVWNAAELSVFTISQVCRLKAWFVAIVANSKTSLCSQWFATWISLRTEDSKRQLASTTCTESSPVTSDRQWLVCFSYWNGDKSWAMIFQLNHRIPRTTSNII